jgi:hypothetical protein
MVGGVALAGSGRSETTRRRLRWLLESWSPSVPSSLAAGRRPAPRSSPPMVDWPGATRAAGRPAGCGRAASPTTRTARRALSIDAVVLQFPFISEWPDSSDFRAGQLGHNLAEAKTC